jgi:hypothetical protein
MSLFKYSFSFCLLFLLWQHSSSVYAFGDVECLNSNMDTVVVHHAPIWPGILRNTLVVNKALCSISIERTSYKLFKKSWSIDICREPIHIKYRYGLGMAKVAKYDGIGCHGIGTTHAGGESLYCNILNDLINTLQDYGLIYAYGERDTLKEEHGQIYCVYLLLKSYLQQAVVFNRKDARGKFLSVTNQMSGASREPLKKEIVDVDADVEVVSERDREVVTNEQ